MRTKQLPLLLLALPFASLAACNWNEVEDGKLGRLELIPSECGQDGCDLDDGIAVGGSLDLSLRGKDGLDASGLRLISSAPWIVDVVAAEDLGLEPRFRIAGNTPGVAELIAIDRLGYEVDYLPVEVAAIAGFDVIASADGLAQYTLPGLGEVLEVNAGTELRLELEGTSRGRSLTGDVQLLVELDQAIAVAMAPGSDPARGELHLRVPAGTHDAVFRAPGGAIQLVRLIGKPVVQPTR